MSVEEIKFDYPLPSSEVDRKILDEGINDIKSAMVRMEGETEFIKEKLIELNERFPELPKEALRNLAKDLVKGTFQKNEAKREAYHELFHAYTTIVAKKG